MISHQAQVFAPVGTRANLGLAGSCRAFMATVCLPEYITQRCRAPSSQAANA